MARDVRVPEFGNFLSFGGNAACIDQTKHRLLAHGPLFKYVGSTNLTIRTFRAFSPDRSLFAKDICLKNDFIHVTLCNKKKIRLKQRLVRGNGEVGKKWQRLSPSKQKHQAVPNNSSKLRLN